MGKKQPPAKVGDMQTREKRAKTCNLEKSAGKGVPGQKRRKHETGGKRRKAFIREQARESRMIGSDN